MKLKNLFYFNAPVTFYFTILCTIVLIIDRYVFDNGLIILLFSAPPCMTEKDGFQWDNWVHYIRLFTHVLGHTDWSHFLSNMAYILLLGPLMEERYGSKMITFMIVITAFVTGVLNVCLIPSVLLGASGICFMLIILSSMNAFDKKKIPVTLYLIIIVYIAKEFVGPAETSNISVAAHIAGGLCGSMFGFLVAPKERKTAKAKETREENSDDEKPAKTKKSAASEKADEFEEQESQWREKWDRIRRERLAKINGNSPRSKPADDDDDDDTTVLGTISL